MAFTLLMLFSKVLVGVCVPLWDFFVDRKRSLVEKESASTRPSFIPSSWAPATLLGTAMVARGEIGLIIIQIGLNETPFLSKKAFVIAVWAIVLNTIIGPVAVGLLLKRVGGRIAGDSRWGTQKRAGEEDITGSGSEELREQ